MTKPTHPAAQRFDTWAETYGEDRISPWFKHYQAMALTTLELDDGNVLDIGCGTGEAVRMAAAQLHRGKACGIDISTKMVDKATVALGDLPNVEFRVANAEAIPYADESFDAVLSTCSFHHYADPVRALNEMRRVMKPAGRLVILDAARDVSVAIWLQDRWRRYLEPSHVRYYTTQELQALVRSVGLRLSEPVITMKRFMFKRKLFTGLMLLRCIKGEHPQHQSSVSVRTPETPISFRQGTS